MINTFTKIILSILILMGSLTSLNAMPHDKKMKNFRAVPLSDAQILQTGKNKYYCPICGMTLPMFYKTNHAAKHDGEHKQYCSITCAVEDEVKNKAPLTNFKTVDTETLKFINSNDAFFVVGSDKPATMSVVSKYAFKNRKDALNFKKHNGGEIMRFKALHELVKNSLQKDMKATKQRQAKAIKKGQMMYHKMCKKTTNLFNSVAEAKSFLKSSKICGNIKGKKHQAIALYLANR